MLKAFTWCAKCLFLYFLVAVTAIRFSWIFTTPVWQIGNQMHWTHLSRVTYVLSYFLPIFAIVGFLLGLVPFGNLGKALSDLFHSFFPSTARLAPEPDRVPPILWAWLPVTVAFLIRFAMWQSRNSSVLSGHRSSGRLIRFFGTLNVQSPGLLDERWITDRFLFTGPMLFLMACALAVFLRHRLLRTRTIPSNTLEE
jgi:hypothetical protein